MGQRSLAEVLFAVSGVYLIVARLPELGMGIALSSSIGKLCRARLITPLLNRFRLWFLSRVLVLGRCSWFNVNASRKSSSRDLFPQRHLSH